MNGDNPLSSLNSSYNHVTPPNIFDRHRAPWSRDRSGNGNIQEETHVTPTTATLEKEEEFVTPDANDKNRIKRSYLLSQAPRTKHVGLPIIRSKINPAEARSMEMGSEVANSSKDLLFRPNGASKRKMNGNSHTSLDEPPASKLPKPLSKCIVQETNHKQPTKKLKSNVNGTNRHEIHDKKLATVIVSKGIEMRRVEATCASNSKPVGAAAAGSPGQAGNDANAKKKCKILRDKTVDTGTTSTSKLKSTSVASASALKHCKPPSSSQTSNLPKPSHSSNYKTAVDKLVSKEIKEKKRKRSPPVSTITAVSESIDNAIRSSVELGAAKVCSVTDPSLEFKTVKEFLEMPQVSLPDRKVEPEKPKVFYKSKFWEYVDPNKKDSTSKSNLNNDKQKNYDQSKVKSYIEKQKELRRQKELAEFQERQQELEKKKRQLQQLNDKCKTIVSKTCGKVKKTPSNVAETVEKPFVRITSAQKINEQSSAEKSIQEKLEKLDIPKDRVGTSNSPSKIMKIGLHQELSSEANSRASLLLKQFETIVKKECIDVFARKQAAKVAGFQRQKVKMDKAVETTSSLDMDIQPFVYSRNSPSIPLSNSTRPQPNPEEFHQLNLAAAKIQAVYKGYKIRKILKEAKILPGMRKSTSNESSDRFKISFELENRPRRRMSFYRTPEKPYDSRTKLKAVPLPSPPRSPLFNNISQHSNLLPQTPLPNEMNLHSYIPPPMSNSSQRGSSHPHPQVLIPLGAPPTRRSFNEPYPKEAIQRLQAASPSMSEKSSRSDILREISIQEAITRRKSLDNLPYLPSGGLQGAKASFVKGRLSDIGSQPPASITDVLFEKLRVIVAQKTRQHQNENVTGAESVEQKRVRNDFALELPYESDFDSVSSIARHSEFVNEARSAEVSITDDYFGPSDSEVRRSSTPKHRSKRPSRLSPRKSRSKSRSRSPKHISSAESTTTVETDVELLPTFDSKEKKAATSSDTHQGSSKTQLLSTVSTPEVNLHNLPMPAIKLRYQAEKERLDVIEKALQATIQHDQARKSEMVEMEQIVKIAKTAADEHIKAKLAEYEKTKPQKEPSKSDGSVQLEMMKCQHEAAKTTAELSKWMFELQKSSMQEQQQKAAQEPINLAAIVYAAVDEAHRMVEEERSKRRQSTARLEIERKVFVSTATHAVEQKDKQFQYPSCSEADSTLPSIAELGDLSNQVEDHLSIEVEKIVPEKKQKQLLPHLTQRIDKAFLDKEGPVTFGKSVAERQSTAIDGDEALKLEKTKVVNPAVVKSTKDNLNLQLGDTKQPSIEIPEDRASSFESSESEKSRKSSFMEQSASALETFEDTISTSPQKEQQVIKSHLEVTEDNIVTDDIDDFHSGRSITGHLSTDVEDYEDYEDLKLKAAKKVISEVVESVEDISSLQKGGVEEPSIEIPEDAASSFESSTKSQRPSLPEQSRQSDSTMETFEETDSSSPQREHPVFKPNFEQLEEDILNKNTDEFHSGTFITKHQSTEGEYVEDLKLEAAKLVPNVVESVENTLNHQINEIEEPSIEMPEDEASSFESSESEKSQKSSLLEQSASPLQIFEEVKTSSPQRKQEVFKSNLEETNGNIIIEDKKDFHIGKSITGSAEVEDDEDLKLDAANVDISEVGKFAEEETSNHQLKYTEELSIEIPEEKTSSFESSESEKSQNSALLEQSASPLQIFEEGNTSSPQRKQQVCQPNIEETEDNNQVTEGKDDFHSGRFITGSAEVEDDAEVNLEASKVVISEVAESAKEDILNLQTKAIEEPSIEIPEDEVSSFESTEKSQKSLLLDQSASVLDAFEEAKTSSPQREQQVFKPSLEDTEVNIVIEDLDDFHSGRSVTGRLSPDVDDNKDLRLEAAKVIIPEVVKSTEDILNLQTGDTEEAGIEIPGDEASSCASSEKSLKSSLPEQSASVLETFEEAKTSSPALETFEEAKTISPALETFEEAKTSAPALETFEEAKTSSPTLETFEEAKTSSPALETFEEAKTTSPLKEQQVCKPNLEETEDNIVIEDLDDLYFGKSITGHLSADVEDDEDLKLEAAKIVKEQLRVENEIRELEALQAQNSPIAAYLSALEQREKPPPPYSPPSSESLSLSSRSLFVTVEDDKLREVIETYVNEIWEPWCATRQLPEPNLVTLDTDEVEDTDKKQEDNMSKWATYSFDLLIADVAQEVTKQILQPEDDSSCTFIDRVRKGPLALEAQKSRVPKTKESLILAIYNKAVETISKEMLPEDMKALVHKRGPIKWTCRPRDLVEEILVEEMVEEEVLWTELWPEELLVVDDLSSKIVRDSIREVLRHLEIAFNNE